MKYLVNGLSPNMFPLNDNGKVAVKIDHLDSKGFCDSIKGAVSMIDHQSTVDLINRLCSTDFKINSNSLTSNKGDEIYIVTLSIRLEEGKILTSDEISQLLQQDKIKFMRVVRIE